MRSCFAPRAARAPRARRTMTCSWQGHLDQGRRVGGPARQSGAADSSCTCGRLSYAQSASSRRTPPRSRCGGQGPSAVGLTAAATACSAAAERSSLSKCWLRQAAWTRPKILAAARCRPWASLAALSPVAGRGATSLRSAQLAGRSWGSSRVVQRSGTTAAARGGGMRAAA
eukprot:359194-Chlamydomonas_euryale.AAC.4